MAYKNDGKGDPTPEKQDNLTSTFAVNGDLFSVAAVPGIGERVGSPFPKPRISPESYVSGGLLSDFAGDWKYCLPGVARVRWIPVYGVSEDINSYLNKASMRVYRMIQDALRQRNLQYQHVDVTVNILAHDSLILGYLFAHRGYEVMNLSNRYSKYYPKLISEACGIDYDSWLQNRPDIVETLKVWRRDLNDFPLPKVFNALDGHYEMMNRFYVDADSAKAQMYVCTPNNLWSYEKVDTLGGLKSVSLNSGKITWSDFKAKYEAMLSAIKNSSDFDMISAGIRSTFGEADAYELPNPDDKVITVVRDPYFLTTLTNALPLANPIVTVKDTGKNWLKCEILGTMTGNGIFPPDVFNTLKDTPTAVEMVNYARWHPYIVESEGSAYAVKSCGTEIIVGFDVLMSKADGISIKGPATGAAVEMAEIDHIAYVTTGTFDTFIEAMTEISAISAFKWHPTLWYLMTSGSAPDIYQQYLPFTQWNFEFEYTGDNLISAHNAWMDAAFASDVVAAASKG